MKHRLLLLMVVMALGGCKVGPDYTPPTTYVPMEYSEDVDGRTFDIQDEDLFEWWKVFNDPCLDDLLDEAISGSFDYRIALEQVREARALYWMQFTQLLPDFLGDAQATRFRTSQSFADSAVSTLSPVRSFFQTGFDAIWEIDVFGGLRRAADAAYDSWEATAEQARAVKIVVLSEVAATYVAIRGDEAKIELIKQAIEIDEDLYEFAKTRFEAGLSTEQDMQALLGTLEEDRASLFALQITLKLNLYSLGVLLGKMPEAVLCNFVCPAPIPDAGGLIPAGIPADLLRRRPDILAAERNLAAASEQIGVAVSELYPTVSLIGSSSSFAANPLQGANIGFSSDKLNKLFDPKSRIWGIGALVTFPVFDWGKRCAGVDAQASIFRQTYLTYQKTVTTALQEVEQGLASYFNEENRQQALDRASRAFFREFILASDLYEAGLGDYTQVLRARDAWISALEAQIDSQAALATDVIAIYKAIGGDW